jgi:pimeloyl-ACP methyl ester carboxylesterase
MYTALNGRRLYYEVHGPAEGPPVVLLHHGLGAVESWEDTTPFLAEAGFRVLVYDRWGYGRSDSRPGIDIPAFREDQEDLLALLDWLEIEQAHLVGHSDGATIALRFAARHPERLCRLAAIAPHVYLEARMESGMAAVQEAYRENSRFQEGMRRLHGEMANSVFSNWYNGWLWPENRNWDMRPELKRIAYRVLVVQGCEDEHAEPKHARETAAHISGAELWLVEGAAHMLPQDLPELFNPRLLDFLTGEGIQDHHHRP